MDLEGRVVTVVMKSKSSRPSPVITFHTSISPIHSSTAASIAEDIVKLAEEQRFTKTAFTLLICALQTACMLRLKETLSLRTGFSFAQFARTMLMLDWSLSSNEITSTEKITTMESGLTVSGAHGQ